DHRRGVAERVSRAPHARRGARAREAGRRHAGPQDALGDRRRLRPRDPVGRAGRNAAHAPGRTAGRRGRAGVSGPRAAKAAPGEGIPVVVSGPSGAGKTSLLKRALERTDRLRFSVSHTTRRPRAGEVDGHDYWFVTLERFQELSDQGAFLEW